MTTRLKGRSFLRELDFRGTLGQRPLRDVTVSDLAAMSFPEGSMGPKVEAACRFVAGTGNRAAIGSLDDVFEVIAGTKGTQVWP